MNERETRTLPLTELRVNPLEGGGSTIVGHAAVFDSWSETLGGIFPFREKVRRGAFEKSIGNDDIRALFNHNPDYVLGRNRSGTLALEEDDVGLKVTITPPDTQWARDMQVSIKRGDISQMSIGFVVVKDDWKTVDDIDVRELIEVQLFDVSPVTFPAYTQTDVGVRAMTEYAEYRAAIKSKEEAAELSAREAREAAEKLEREKRESEERAEAERQAAEQTKRSERASLARMQSKFKTM